jgi:hypothetical protein
VAINAEQANLRLAELLAPPSAPPESESEIGRELVRYGLEWGRNHVINVLPSLHEVAGVLADDEDHDDQLMLVIQLLHHAELQLPEMLGRVVALAVSRGASWSSIADSLECTRQGAQKRFSHIVTLLAISHNIDTVNHPGGRRIRR